MAAPIRSRIGSLNRRLTKIEADEGRLKDFAERSYEGELLKANLGKMRKGMATIEVLDWNSGQNRTVMLDPALSPIENMERIFKKSAKGKRGERAVRQRLSQTLEEKQALEDLLFFVTDAESIAELEEIPGELRAGNQCSVLSLLSRVIPIVERNPACFAVFRLRPAESSWWGKAGRATPSCFKRKLTKVTSGST